MGQLKFRVWCINKCEWETDRILIGLDGTLYHQSKQMYMRPVNPETHIVEQFTGLLDKNGVEIYEGDLIEFRSERFTNFGNTPTGKYSIHVDVIEWMGIECAGRGRGCWGLRVVSADSFNKHRLGNPVSSAIHVHIHLYGEVTGNIHEPKP